MSRTHHAQESLAACVRAAQRDADRFYGSAPARPWQPRLAWRPWLAGAVLTGAAASAALLLWPAPSQQAVDAPLAVVAAAAPAAMVPAVAPSSDAATLPADAAPALPAGLAAQPSAPAQAAVDPGPPLPADLNDWALDPQPGAPQAEAAVLPLHNVPEPPDDNDTTPADDAAVPDAEAGGGLGE